MVLNKLFFIRLFKLIISFAKTIIKLNLSFMKKLILSIALSFSFLSNAQDYYHGIGLQYNMGIFNYSYVSPGLNYSFSGAMGVPGIVYKSSLAFEAGRSSNFAISAYPFLGFMLNNTTGSYLGAELPILAEFVKGDLDDQCFFIGAGFSFSYLNAGGDGGAIVGPQIGLGGQFEFRDNLVGLRGSYTYGVNKGNYIPADATSHTDKKMMIAVGIYYLLGQ